MSHRGKIPDVLSVGERLSFAARLLPAFCLLLEHCQHRWGQRVSGSLDKEHMRINHVMFGGKIYKVHPPKQVGSNTVTDIRIRQSYPKGKRKTELKPEDWHTDWITVRCWGQTSEIAQELEENQFITVEGRLRHEEWKNKEGQTQSRVVLVATFIHRVPGTFNDVTSDKAPAGVIPPESTEEVPF